MLRFLIPRLICMKIFRFWAPTGASAIPGIAENSASICNNREFNFLMKRPEIHHFSAKGCKCGFCCTFLSSFLWKLRNRIKKWGKLFFIKKWFSTEKTDFGVINWFLLKRWFFMILTTKNVQQHHVFSPLSGNHDVSDFLWIFLIFGPPKGLGVL